MRLGRSDEAGRQFERTAKMAPQMADARANWGKWLQLSESVIMPQLSRSTRFGVCRRCPETSRRGIVTADRGTYGPVFTAVRWNTELRGA
jgi:hypothetical protein